MTASENGQVTVAMAVSHYRRFRLESHWPKPGGVRVGDVAAGRTVPGGDQGEREGPVFVPSHQLMREYVEAQCFGSLCVMAGIAPGIADAERPIDTADPSPRAKKNG